NLFPTTPYTPFTLDGGILQYAGATDTTPFPIVLTAAGGTVEVANAATTLSLTGSITGVGPFTKAGPGVLVLNNPANLYAAGIVVNAGRLDVADDNQLGLATVTVNPAGTLRMTANTSTARFYTLFSGAVEVPSGVTWTVNGASISGGFFRG